MPRIVLRLLLALGLCLVATTAFAVTRVVTDTERSATRQEIITQLGPAHSYALLIGISDFDNAGWHRLEGVGPEIQKIGGALSAGWSIGRIERVSRAILVAGVFELLAREDVPAKVAINEYVEIAHAFYDDNEPGFVNSVLDRLARQLRPGEFESGAARGA